MPKGLIEFVSWLAWIGEWLCIGALSAVCFALDVTIPDSGKPKIFLQPVVEFVHEWPTLIGISLGLAIVVVRCGRWLGKRPSPQEVTLNRLVTETLDRFRDTCFPGIPANEPKDHNRVTVFRHEKCWWIVWPFRGTLTPWGFGRHPWSGWLVMHRRSGHVTRGRRTTFLAPDDAQNAEGVVGQAWRRQAHRVGSGQSKLPVLAAVKHVGAHRALWYRTLNICKKPTAKATQFCIDLETVRNYAEATHCSTKFVWQRIKQKTPLPTSLLAVPLRDKNKDFWGVAVMDSCNQYECIDTDSREFRTAFNKLEQQLHSFGVMDDAGR